MHLTPAGSSTRAGRRREAIERKHASETSVDVFSVKLRSGVDQRRCFTPPVRAWTFRPSCSPTSEGVIRGADPRTVGGRQRAVASY